MRVYLRRWFAMFSRRFHFSGLTAENRHLVRVFLFLLAFAGSWQFTIWIFANGAISAPYVAFADSNDSTSNAVTLSRHPLNLTVAHAVNVNDSIGNSNPIYRALEAFNLTEFHLVEEPRNCSGDQLVSIVVSSAPGHFNRRQIIRQTWGQTTRPIFFLGLTLNRSLADEIRRESVQYGDIVQGFFVDAYKNLTYKHVVALAWAEWKCPSKFILKVDDDVYINTAKVPTYLQSLDESSAEDQDGAIFCDVVRDANVKRSFRSKWRVTFREFPRYKYPDYCSGWTIIYTRTTISRLLERIKSVPYLWVDDVYVTGLLAHEADVERKSIDHELLSLDWSDWDVDDSEHKSEKQKKLAQIVFGPPQLTAEQMEQMWRLETWKSQ